MTSSKFGVILKDDAFWHSKLAPQDLVGFQIVGYDGVVPEIDSEKKPSLKVTNRWERRTLVPFSSSRRNSE